MSEIFLYAGENLTDSSENYAIDVADFQSVTTVPDVKSLKVTSGIWIVYSEANYNGNIAVYKAGRYRSALKLKTVGSFRKLPGTLENPDIIVFEESSCHGPQKEFKENGYQYVPFPIMSHTVGNGVWILYDGAEYTGKSIVGITGDKVPNETVKGLNGPVKSLKAYLTYEQ